MPTCAVPSRSSSLRELRAVAQPPEFSPSAADTVYRVFSIYLSIPLAHLGAAPNVLTYVWIVLGLAGAAGLAAPSWTLSILGALVLQFSYLLDFVDGEVARLTEKKSILGEFLDLLGHGLIKTSLPLAAGWSAAAATGAAGFLVVGAVGALAIGVGDSLRFYAACTSRNLASGDLAHVVLPPRMPWRARGAGNLARVAFLMSFQTPGLLGLALLGAVSGRLDVLSVWWALGGTVWFMTRAVHYGRRLVVPGDGPSEPRAPNGPGSPIV
ncbi:MAG: CDP-alcohol phosphatidyltransferase family protein [Candidatus Rokuibacteriota bacterium]